VIEALGQSAARPNTHGYAPFAGLPALSGSWHRTWLEEMRLFEA
jgi:hypothetical protein